jgi:hypothetical protein
MPHPLLGLFTVHTSMEYLHVTESPPYACQFALQSCSLLVHIRSRSAHDTTHPTLRTLVGI